MGPAAAMPSQSAEFRLGVPDEAHQIRCPRISAKMVHCKHENPIYGRLRAGGDRIKVVRKGAKNVIHAGAI